VRKQNNLPVFLVYISEFIGNTPLVRINSLSDALGVEILAKAEVSFSKRFFK